MPKKHLHACRNLNIFWQNTRTFSCTLWQVNHNSKPIIPEEMCRWKWLGHVLWMSTISLPRVALRWTQVKRETRGEEQWKERWRNRDGLGILGGCWSRHTMVVFSGGDLIFKTAQRGCNLHKYERIADTFSDLMAHYASIPTSRQFTILQPVMLQIYGSQKMGIKETKHWKN